MKTLKHLILNELADMYDAEHRIVRALPRFAKASTCDELKQTLLNHAAETEGHIAKVEQVFAAFDAQARKQACKATIGLLEEGTDLAAEFKDSTAIDAALISFIQKIEHYEMAAYGCLLEWAELLENRKAAKLLTQILAEERVANDTLTRLARAKSNQAAFMEAAPDEPPGNTKSPRQRSKAPLPQSKASRRPSMPPKR